ncbi:hypothetical protein [Mycolicibacterium hassiacum]|uniref:hypothetical protein n=1 Tax=Mycolicibacterium hassiacum TaxID=46351 RepID=UPI001E658EF8|nr:hypothetical protein [Mycolicibacterium hassiacum]
MAAVDEVVVLSESDLSSEEHPDSPAITIAAPPTAAMNPRFTTGLLFVAVTRRGRVISSSMVGEITPIAGFRSKPIRLSAGNLDGELS